MTEPYKFRKLASACIGLLIVLFAYSTPSMAGDGELDLYYSSGKAVAYIAEDDATIYLWSGEPVAYLKADNVFGFNGKHLGWYRSGAVYDHDGAVVGCTRGRYLGSVEAAPFKAFKQFKPFKAFTEFAPFKPSFTTTWSDDSLRLFLMQGSAE